MQSSSPTIVPTFRRRLKLVDASTLEAKPTWIQLASAQTPAVDAALIMGCNAKTAAKMLQMAIAVLESNRTADSLLMACDAAGGDYRQVRNGVGAEDKARSFHGLSNADIAKLPMEEYAGQPYQLKIRDERGRTPFSVKHEGVYGEWERRARAERKAEA